MSEYDNDHLCSLRAALLDHPIYTHVASVADLRHFMEDHVFAVWDFMSLLKRLQQDMTCIKVPWFPADNAKAARLINDIVIGEETDVGPDGSYVSHLGLYLRAMRDIGASTRQFEKFRSLVFVGVPVEVALARIGAPPHVQAFVAHTMALANSGSTEEVLAAFFYGREDVIPEMFDRLLTTLYGAKHDDDRLRHFIYYVDRHTHADRAQFHLLQRDDRAFMGLGVRPHVDAASGDAVGQAAQVALERVEIDHQRGSLDGFRQTSGEPTLLTVLAVPLPAAPEMVV